VVVPQVVAQPCLVATTDLLPGPIPIAVPNLEPGTCLLLVPVLVPQPAVALLPPLQLQVLPALGQVLSPAPFYDTPIQFLPTGQSEFQYFLEHPLLFCGTDEADTCEALAEQLAEVAPGFGTLLSDGPDGYGVYLTYTANPEDLAP